MQKQYFGADNAMIWKLLSVRDQTIYTMDHKSVLFERNDWEHSGSVVECLTRDRGAAGSSLTGVTVLCPWARHINPCLVLVQPRKTLTDITERLLTGTSRIKSNKAKEIIDHYYVNDNKYY